MSTILDRVILQTINRFAIKLLSLQNTDELLCYVAQEVVGNLGFDDCVVYRVDEEAQEIFQAFAINEKLMEIGEIINPLRIPIGHGITGAVALSGKPELINDLSQDGRYIKDISDARSEIAVPVTVDGRVYAVIDCEDGKPDVFDSSHLEILETIAAITSARLTLFLKDEEAKAAQKKLYQAQKMEALELLVGGIVHDINNYLTVILGHAELIERNHPHLSAHTAPLLRSACGAESLLQKLLAFGRWQMLYPTVLNLAGCLAQMRNMIEALLGEENELEMIIESPLPNCMLDQIGLESAIFNLIANARESMPGGGRVIVKCQSFTIADDGLGEQNGPAAGDYVQLSVIDGGTGMDAKTIERAFEPFFTTKTSRQNSGLGLSQIHGFVSQSGGFADIRSEPGKGTEVHIYFPVTGDEPNQTDTANSNVPLLSTHGQESILVIEDEPKVRELTETVLTNLGYKVRAADGGHAAEKLLRSNPGIDLVLSDVILANDEDGPLVVEKLRQIKPGVPAIYMSGYPCLASERTGFFGTDNVLLSKPLRITSLARAIRQVLDNK